MRILPLLLIPVLLAGCGLKHEEYKSDREIPDGPGVFSGEKGGLVYSGDPLGLRKDREPPEQAGEQQPAAAQAPAAAGSTGSASRGDDFSDYEEFLRYKEFQRWKETAQGGPEYREFQDWREWKEYRRWQRQKSQ